MSQARRVVAAALLLFVLGTVGAMPLGASDMAGSPSYFDGRDSVDALGLLDEGPTGLVPAATLLLVVVAAMASARGAPSPRSLAAPLPARHRVPPLR
ncbi:MAG TPA: hypothetical protein VJU81_02670 [Methylomirabilota bacterium]|nr:hypothetical protein [Methylomirabilota bacterium]